MSRAGIGFGSGGIAIAYTVDCISTLNHICCFWAMGRVYQGSGLIYSSSCFWCSSSIVICCPVATFAVSILTFEFWTEWRLGDVADRRKCFLDLNLGGLIFCGLLGEDGPVEKESVDARKGAKVGWKRPMCSITVEVGVFGKVNQEMGRCWLRNNGQQRASKQSRICRYVGLQVHSS